MPNRLILLGPDCPALQEATLAVEGRFLHYTNSVDLIEELVQHPSPRVIVFNSESELDGFYELARRIRTEANRYVPLVLLANPNLDLAATWTKAGGSAVVERRDEPDLMRKAMDTLVRYWLGVNHQATDRRKS